MTHHANVLLDMEERRATWPSVSAMHACGPVLCGEYVAGLVFPCVCTCR